MERATTERGARHPPRHRGQPAGAHDFAPTVSRAPRAHRRGVTVGQAVDSSIKRQKNDRRSFHGLTMSGDFRRQVRHSLRDAIMATPGIVPDQCRFEGAVSNAGQVSFEKTRFLTGLHQHGHRGALPRPHSRPTVLPLSRLPQVLISSDYVPPASPPRVLLATNSLHHRARHGSRPQPTATLHRALRSGHRRMSAQVGGLRRRPSRHLGPCPRQRPTPAGLQRKRSGGRGGASHNGHRRVWHCPPHQGRHQDTTEHLGTYS